VVPGNRSDTREALELLGNLIELARRERRWTIEHTAAVIGMNPRTYRAIELGKPTAAIGAAFDAATALGVPLFAPTVIDAKQAAQITQNHLALLPQRAPTLPELNNDF